MPRLPPSLFWRARHISPGAALLLPVCRDFPSALAELRWIREHVKEKSRGRLDWEGRERILSLCRRRGRGEPLQYVLGTQPFGSLDLLCRRGVLIPRPEPEAYSLHLADLLLRESKQSGGSHKSLTILDACTGTGCIALLLYAQLQRKMKAADSLHVVGIDLAPQAVSLSRKNAVRNRLLSAGDSTSIKFVQCDVFSDDWLDHQDIKRLYQSPLDILVSNPPYISVDGFSHDTARSVRIFEPKLAQVPLPRGPGSEVDEDIFYVRLLELATRMDARIVLCEVGRLAQAERVVGLALNKGPLLNAEIWADHPDIVDVDCTNRSVTVAGREVPIKGSGHGRSVFIRRR
ncbi:hypothetical protein SEUCBS139899_007404 [Sporothrix eucalyptigena]